jgi:aminopeptidase N
VAAGLAAALIAAAVRWIPVASAAEAGAGAPGAGDSYFPLDGNGGFDVGHYDLRLDYDPPSRRLVGHATVTATAAQDLSRFDLDLSGFTVSGVTVDGTAATFTRDGQELVVTPKAAIRSGATFADTGVIIDDVEVGYQMETQTRPLLPGPPKDGVLEHELAHQWFGNAVTPRLWKDVWLNEGFASYAAMMWSEEHGDGDLDEFYDDWMTKFAHHPMWRLTMGDLGAADMLNIYMYSRGLLFLHALRRTVGDNAFFATLRAWTQDDKYKNATTQDFQALAERTSGKDLDALVRAWVYTPSQPPYTPKPSR